MKTFRVYSDFQGKNEKDAFTQMEQMIQDFILSGEGIDMYMSISKIKGGKNANKNRK